MSARTSPTTRTETRSRSTRPARAAARAWTSSARSTTRRYDGRDLPWTETVGADNGTDADDKHQRTTVTEFDPNGNLRREVNPKGVDEGTKLSTFTYGSDAELDGAEASKNATVHEYSKDNLRTAIRQPWGTNDGEDSKRYTQRFRHDARGWVCAIVSSDEGTGDAPADPCASGKKTTTYKHFDTGWISESKDPAYEDASSKSQTIAYAYDLRGNQTLWRSGPGREITRAYWPNGRLRERVARGKAKSDGTRPDRQYAYRYNANGSMTEMRDLDKSRTTKIDRDAVEREVLTDEDWSGGKDTTSRYDANGNVTRRQTDGQYHGGDSYEGGKTTTYAFDPLDRETSSTADPSAAGEKTRTTSTSYWPSGERQQRTKDQEGDSSPAVTDSWFFYNDGQIARMRRQKRGASGTDQRCVRDAGLEEKDQCYAYDRNGNRQRDERGSYAFNSRDQVSKWTRRSDAATNPGSSVNYKLDGSGAMREKEDLGSGEKTSFDYDGDRLRSSTTTGGPTPGTTSYSYDEFGATTGSAGPGAGQPAPGVSPCAEGGSNAPGSFGYDEFGRMTCGIGRDGKKVQFTYDGLDRRDAKTQDGRTSDMSYVGSTEALSQEQGPGSTSGNKTQTYDYDSSGERLGTASGDNGQAAQYRSYATDANGSVEGLEEADGQVKPENAYEYDPYGQQERKPGETQPGESMGQAAKDNPFRFEGFYADQGLDTYDMQARPYQPKVGRFLTQDRYEASRGDLSLQSDPLTQNRYAFAGGNPINRIEWDGHLSLDEIGDAFESGFNDFKEGAADAGNALKDFGKGAAEGAVDTGKGLLQAGAWAVKSNPTTNPNGLLGTVDQWKKNVGAAKTVAEHPKEAAEGAKQQITEPYKHGSDAEKAGRATVDVAGVFAGALGAAGKAGKAGQVAGAVARSLAGAVKRGVQRAGKRALDRVGKGRAAKAPPNEPPPSLGFTRHAADQLARRGVRTPDVLDAYRNPLERGPIRFNDQGRPDQKFIGNKATIVLNPETRRIITGYPTSSRIRHRLLRRAQGGR